MGLFDFILSKDTKNRLKEAEETTDLAKGMVDEAESSYFYAEEQCTESLQKLDGLKKEIYSNSMASFIKAFSQIKDIEFNIPKEIDELSNFYFSDAVFIYNSVSCNQVSKDFSTVNVGVKVAGMAAESILGISQYMMKYKSSKILDDAKRYYKDAKETVQKYVLATDMCSYIQARADMFTAVLNKQNEMFVPLVRNMERIIQQKGTAYNTYDRYEQQSVAAAVSMVTGIKAVLDVKILNEYGELTTESKELAISMAEQLKLPYNEYELGDSDSYSSSSGYDNDNDNYGNNTHSNSVVANKVYDIIVDTLGVEYDEINEYATADDLGADSLDAAELIMEFEKEFGITIPESDAERMETVGDVICYIENCMH